MMTSTLTLLALYLISFTQVDYLTIAHDGLHPKDSMEKFQEQLEKPQTDCNSAIPISCDSYLTDQTTQWSANNFDATHYSGCFGGTWPFNAPENVYVIEVPSRQNYRFVLDILDPVDLDMLLFDYCPGGIFLLNGTSALCEGVSLTDNVNTGVYKEILDVILDPGTYYLFVDGYTSSQVGHYNLKVSCECTCTEEFDPQTQAFGRSVLCENFEDYDLTSVALQGSRWWMWDTTLIHHPTVTNLNGNQVLSIQYNSSYGNNQQDIIYNLTDLQYLFYGRQRISWNMFIDQGKTGYYNVLHNVPDPMSNNSAGVNWAYEVVFNENGTGDLYIFGTSAASDADFIYRPGEWNNVMQIIDINEGTVELWINHNYVYTWNFSNGSHFFSSDLGGINFYAIPNSSFKIDKICAWDRYDFFPSCVPDGSICIKNNDFFYSRCDAGFYGLYTPAEWGACYGICEQGGQFIYLGDTWTDTLTTDDLAPPLLLQEPCVIDAYGGSLPPGPMYADIYVLNFDIESQIIPQELMGTTSPDTKLFMFRCHCTNGECVQECYGEVGDPNLCNFPNDCFDNGYYYFVALSPVNDTYGFQVFPSGTCPTPEDVFTCSNLSPISSTVADGFTDFDTGAGSAGDYSSCYNGFRTYGGREIVYRLDVDKPSTVSISLIAEEQMAVFLFDKICGKNCIGYAENPDGGGQALLDSISLDEGVYYIVVDKNTLGGDETFTLDISCQQITNFVNTFFVLDEAANCQYNYSQSHEVGVRNFAYNFSPNHIIAFMVNDGQDIKPIKDMGKFWNGADPLVFDIPLDSNGVEKCSYDIGDSLLIYLFNTSDGWFSGGPCYIGFQPGNSATFQANGESVVNSLAFQDINNFGVNPNFLNVGAEGATKSISVGTNLPWHLEYDNSVDWLTFSKTSAQAGTDLAITIAPNDTCISRLAIVRFVFEDDPPLQRFVSIFQWGQCIVPAVDIVPDPSFQICSGASLTLTATVSNSCLDGYNILWSTGETTPSITVQPNQNTPYSVTLKSKNCLATSGKSVNVTIVPPPAPPTYTGDLEFCQGETVTLQASSAAGTMTRWYNVPSGGTPLHTGNSYIPSPQPGVGLHQFYLESVGNNPPNCASPPPRVPITVQVFAQPVANAGSDKKLNCNNTTVTLNASASTPFGATFTWMGPGFVSGQNTAMPVVNLPGIYTVTVNNNGCIATDNVQVTSVPAPAANMSSVVNAKCFGQASGSATVSVTGGSTPYTYLWSNGSMAASASNLPAGNYTVTVTDADGCTSTASATVTQPNALTVTAGTVTNINCFNPVGSATVAGSGGTGNYTYNWSNGAVGANASFATGGSYTVTLTDANQCTASTNVTISQTTPPSLSASVSNHVLCHGASTGSAMAVGQNGTLPYTYQWSNNTTGAILNQATAGIYQVTLTDAIGCKSTASVIINQPSAALSVNFNVINQGSTGANDGSVAANPSGGTPPYSYQWATGQTTQQINNLPPGTYTVTVTDANNCTMTGQAIVNPFLCGGVGVNISPTHISCNGANDGSALAQATGAGSISFQWSTGAQTAQISNLPPGSYTVTITDDNNCTQSATTFIVQPGVLTVGVVSQANVTCFGMNNGSATLTATGGTSPHSYAWPNGATNASAVNLAPGNHVVTVTDANNCNATVTVTITQPNVLLTNATSTNETGINLNNGTASANPSGGTPPYTYAWSNNATTPGITNLAPGSYTVTVTDNKSCQSIQTVTVIAFDCAGIGANVIANEISCHDETDGTLTAIPSGGTFPFTYTWSNGTTGPVNNNLGSGIYTVSIVDNNLCTLIIETELAEPTELQLALASVEDAKCFGENSGSATVTASGGTGVYLYKWPNGNSGPTANNLAAGNYTVSVTDENGCEDVLSVTIDEPDELHLELLDLSNVQCFENANGSITVGVTGGAGSVQYAWSNGKTGPSIGGLNAGNYTVTATDANGCTAEMDYTVAGPAAALDYTQLVITNATGGQNNGSISITITGGTPPYIYEWEDEAGTFFEDMEDISNLAPGNYSLTVIDQNNCGLGVQVTVDNVSSVSQTGTDLGVRLFPNPASRQVQVEFSKPVTGPVELELIDILGQKVQSVSLENAVYEQAQIGLEEIRPGVYLVKIKVGSMVAVERLIVH
jgi:hypothetical protein